MILACHSILLGSPELRNNWTKYWYTSTWSNFASYLIQNNRITKAVRLCYCSFIIVRGGITARAGHAIQHSSSTIRRGAQHSREREKTLNWFIQAIFVRHNERFVWSLAMDAPLRCQPCKSTKWIVCYPRIFQKMRKNCVSPPFILSFFAWARNIRATSFYLKMFSLINSIWSVWNTFFCSRDARSFSSYSAARLRRCHSQMTRISCAIRALDPSDWRANLEFAIYLNILAARKATSRETPKSIDVLYFALSLFGVQFIVSMTLVRTRSTLSALHTQSQCWRRGRKAERNMFSICSLFLIRRNWHHFKHDEEEENLLLQHKPRMSRAKMSQHRKNTTPKRSKKMCLALIFHFVSFHLRCFLDMNRDYLMLRFPYLCRFELSFRRPRKSVM